MREVWYTCQYRPTHITRAQQKRLATRFAVANKSYHDTSAQDTTQEHYISALPKSLTLQKSPTKEPYNRDRQKSPTKELYNRALQKSPTKETYNRDWQKSPTKEPCTLDSRCDRTLVCRRHTWMSHGTYGWVVAHMNEARHVWIDLLLCFPAVLLYMCSYKGVPPVRYIHIYIHIHTYT